VAIRDHLLLSLLTLLALSPEAISAPEKFGTFGIDLTAQDNKVLPGDDFFAYANGHWLETTKIPADRSSWSASGPLSEQLDERVRKLIQDLPRAVPAGNIQQKIGDYNRAFLDENAIERAGLKPVQPYLNAIAAARSYKDIATLMGRKDLRLASPISIEIGIDEKKS